MSNTVLKTANCTVDTFGGLCTQTGPSSTPKGLATDCQDVVFFPGQVQSRPCLDRLLTSAISTTSITYLKTYVQPNEEALNLILSSDGNLWREDVDVSPGAKTLIQQLVSGSYANSVSAFGREYIALNDGLHGTDVPLQYDGTNLDRVSQDGPGASGSAANESGLSFDIAASPNGLLLENDAIAAGPNGLIESGNIVKITPNASLLDKPWKVGDYVTVSGAGVTAYNGTWIISALDLNPMRIYFVHPQTGLAASGGGKFTVHIGTVVTTAPYSFTAGQFVTIVAASDPSWDGTWEIRSLIDSTSFTIVLGQTLPGQSGSVFPGVVTLNGWGASAHVGDYEAGVTQGHSHPMVTDGGTTDPYNNPNNAIDDDPVTYADSSIQGSHTYAGMIVEFTNPGAVAADLVLTIISSVPANGTGGLSVNTRTASVWYSIDNGVTWTNVYDVGGPAGRPKQTDTIILPSGTDPLDVQVECFNDAHDDMVHRVNLVALGPVGGVSSGGGTISSAGQVSIGVHQFVVMYLTRQGYITKPSPVSSWSANGSSRVLITNIPIGPANVIARIIAFTGAGGDNFFYIPVTVTNPDGTITQTTVIPDNTTTSMTFDFADNALFAATAIDIPGNNLFALVVLGPCLGMAQFAARLFAWGERNKVQNFLNMGFDGGYVSSNPTVPTGWFNSTTDGGGLFNGGAWASGQAWLITGDGSASQRGLLTQSAYQDEDGQPIILPSTNYTARAWLRRTGGTAGFVAFRLNSVTLGIIASGSMNISDVSTVGEFHEVALSGTTPAVIPSDIQLEIYAQNQGNGDTVTVDEAEMIYTENPFTDSIFRGSYVLNPESFDGVTGTMGSLGDSSPIRAPFPLRNTFFFNTAQRLQATTDNANGEPSTWSVLEVDKVGALSSRATAAGGEGEDWQFFASRAGVYIFSGSTPMKLMQEMQSSPDGTVFPTWEDINWDKQSTIWMTNDPVNRRLYVAAPTNNIEASPWEAPSILFVMDYKNLESAEAIASRGALFPMGNGLGTGDLARKWTRWNCFLDCGAIISRGGNVTTFGVGSGNGTPPGDDPAFGQIYQFSEDKLSDDDYGQISPYYQTSFLVPDDEAQGIGVGTHRKQAAYLTCFLQGQGNMVITPYVNTSQNPWNSTPLLLMSLTRNFDTEIGLNVLGERIAYKFSPQPLEGETDVFFSLGTLSIAYRPDPYAPVGGRSL